MTQSVSAITNLRDSKAAGAELGRIICAGFNEQPADAIIVFASADHDYRALLAELGRVVGTSVVVGSSSAGEFTHEQRGEGYVSAMALRSPSMKFSVGIGRNITRNHLAAARDVVSEFEGLSDRPMPYRAALVMTDALAGHTDAMVEEMTLATGGNYRFFGGGAGDDGRFQQTHVFAGTESLSDAIVALEMQSLKPIGIGVSHGWEPAGAGLRVTEAEGARLISLNGAPAVHAFEEHAESTGQTFDAANALPFFLHNILGIATSDGYRLRVPLGVMPDGSVMCAAAIPKGSVVHVMKTTNQSAVLAAEQATRNAIEALDGQRPQAAFVFDCVATRLRTGASFDDELKACANLLAPAKFVGCNTYGQIARAEGQFGGFHNCTAVVCVLPE